ncbi:MAG TPA: WD40 repeat domain-containing protein, partial [Candidatus Limnocylindrales bacterium]|nr:WD40 repeat domain-containing protein [Candidatus Limnocylindrales bacterium]
RVAFDDISADGFRLVVADIASGTRIREIDPGFDELYTRDLNEDGSLLLAGDRPMVVFDVDGGGARIADFAGHAGESFYAEFGPSSDTVYSTGRDATLRRWDGRSGEEIAVSEAAGSGRPSVSEDGTRVLVSDIELGRATLLDLTRHGEARATPTCRGFVAASGLDVHDGLAALLHGQCHDDGTGLLGRTFVVDLADGDVLSSVPGTDGQLLRISPDGERLLLQPGSFPIAEPPVIRDLRSGRPLVELDGVCAWNWDEVGLRQVPRVEAGACAAFPEEPFPIWALSMRWSPDGSMVFAADNHNMDGYWAVWDAATGHLVHIGAEAPGRQVFDAVFTPDSSALVVADYDTGVLRRYSTTTWGLLQTAELPGELEGRDRIWFAGYTPNGTTLLAVGGFLGAGGGSLHWLDATTLQPQGASVLRAHDGSPKAVAISPDGSLVAIGASGDPVRVWDVASRELVHELPLGDVQAQGVAFVDDLHIVVAPQGGDLLIMTLDPDELIAIGRSSLTRGFTATECRRYGFGSDCPTLEDLSHG